MIGRPAPTARVVVDQARDQKDDDVDRVLDQKDAGAAQADHQKVDAGSGLGRVDRLTAIDRAAPMCLRPRSCSMNSTPMKTAR